MPKLTSQKVFDLEYFFQITPDLICIAGFDGYFKKINPAISKTLGYTEEELYSSPITTFIHADDKELTNQKHADLSKGLSLLNFENRYVAQGGSIVWLSWTSVPIVRDHLFFGIAKNITYRKQVEEYDRISSILGMINEDHQKRFKKVPRTTIVPNLTEPVIVKGENNEQGSSYSDQFWLDNFETVLEIAQASGN